MERHLIDYLPPVFREVEEMKAVMMDAEQSELSNMWEAVENVFHDQYISDATANGVIRWEKILNISSKATDSLEARKFRVISRLNESLPYTMTTLKQILTTLCGSDGYAIELLSDIYTLSVKVTLIAKSNYDDVDQLLHRIAPANVVIEISLMYNQHSTLAKYTHAQLSVYTYEQLRNEVLNHGE